MPERETERERKLSGVAREKDRERQRERKLSGVARERER